MKWEGVCIEAWVLQGMVADICAWSGKFAPRESVTVAYDVDSCMRGPFAKDLQTVQVLVAGVVVKLLRNSAVSPRWSWIREFHSPTIFSRRPRALAGGPVLAPPPPRGQGDWLGSLDLTRTVPCRARISRAAPYVRRTDFAPDMLFTCGSL